MSTMNSKLSSSNRKWTAAMLVIAASLLASSCRKDEDDDHHDDHNHGEEELITTVRAAFTPVGGGAPAVFSWVDADGDGGNAPVITGDTLLPGTTYNAMLLLLNESVSPVDTVSNEVAAEAAAHQFFFSTTGGSLAWSAYGDSDPNGRPIGLLSTWATTGAGSGQLRIILRHELNKAAAGVSGGDITNAGGSTDIDVAMPYWVQ